MAKEHLKVINDFANWIKDRAELAISLDPVADKQFLKEFLELALEEFKIEL